MEKTKGKNFSRNNTGKRKKSDLYETPYSLTRLLVAREEFGSSVLEPCCGHGAITKVLHELGYQNVTSYDLAADGIDFLDEDRVFDSVVTNPPYSLSYEFISKCKSVSRNRFALLLPLTYLQGNRRLKEIWSDASFPLQRIYVFSRYPLLGEALREDGKVNTGMQAYAWYIWDNSYAGEPTIRWLDLNPWIIRKRDLINS